MQSYGRCLLRLGTTLPARLQSGRLVAIVDHDGLSPNLRLEYKVVTLGAASNFRSTILAESVDLPNLVRSIHITFRWGRLPPLSTQESADLTLDLPLFEGHAYLLTLVLTDTQSNEVVYRYEVPISGECREGDRNQQTAAQGRQGSHQYVVRICAPDIQPRDAVGNFCKELARILTSRGHEVHLYAENFPLSDFGSICKTSELFADLQPSDLLFVNYSIFDPLLTRFLAIQQRKLCFFQNVTPGELLEAWDPNTAQLCRWSEAQLPLLAGFDELMAHSCFTAESLQKHLPAPRNIGIAPPLFRDSFERSFPRKLPHPIHAPTLLFVGRVAPHKCIHELVFLQQQLERLWPGSKTIVVGDLSNEAYRSHLEALRHEHLLEPAHFVLMGSVSGDELRARYQEADAFVCVSEHEGFCVPLLEAMATGLPVFAYAQPAVVEVLGGTGLVYSNKNMLHWAHDIQRTLADTTKLAALVTAEQSRAEEILGQADGTPIIRALEGLAARPLRQSSRGD